MWDRGRGRGSHAREQKTANSAVHALCETASTPWWSPKGHGRASPQVLTGAAPLALGQLRRELKLT